MLLMLHKTCLHLASAPSLSVVVRTSKELKKNLCMLTEYMERPNVDWATYSLGSG